VTILSLAEARRQAIFAVRNPAPECLLGFNDNFYSLNTHQVSCPANLNGRNDGVFFHAVTSKGTIIAIDS
jgi:hypothetical protein